MHEARDSASARPDADLTGRMCVDVGAQRIVRSRPAGLTDRQREYLTAIERLTAERGISPTLRELGGVVGTRNTNAIRDVLRVLERKGFIAREPKHARSLRVLRPSGAGVTTGTGHVAQLLEIRGRIASAESWQQAARTLPETDSARRLLYALNTIDELTDALTQALAVIGGAT